LHAPSLARRLVLAVSIPLTVFFGLTVFALDVVVRGLVERSLDELLEAQMVALIASAEPSLAGRSAEAPRLADTRLETPGSGLYAGIDGPGGEWRSPSAIGTFVDFGPPLAGGERRARRARLPSGAEIEVRSRGIEWSDESGELLSLTFSVATSLEPYRAQLWRFRRQVIGAFAILAGLVLATLFLLQRWVLAPARRLEAEIRDVEAGAREHLSPAWPRELSGVATNLNALLAAERARIDRYRRTLGNLAHALKTPLAVLSSALQSSDGMPAPTRATLRSEVDRMAGIVEHQLRRAATAGGRTVGQAPVAVRPIVADLRTALLRAHARKDFALENAVGEAAYFLGSAEDLTELLGNLLDNACKWCRSRVVASGDASGVAVSGGLRITVEDDGPGIADADRARVLQRGERADETTPGHGLGLAIVREAVELYGGSLEITTSPLGGASVRVRLPGRAEP
jgi:two-component system sensor histidine kinase PhoQ